MINPIIAYDADDVLLDTVTKWIRRYNHYYDDVLEKKDVLDWNIASYTKLRNEPEKFYHLLDTFLYKGVDAVEGALSGFQKSRKYGRVIVVTSNFGDVGRAKLDALNYLGFEISKKDFVECQDKSLICCDILFDDNIDNATSAYNDNGWLFSQPWNLKYDFPRRVSSWNEINDVLERKFG